MFFARILRRERRVFYFPWRITLALEGSQTSLRRESAEGERLVFRFPFSPFRFYPPLRPLRSLREVCLRAVVCFLHADYAESAEFYIFLGVLRWRWRGRKLRYDERAQRGDVSEAV